jgi:hypothetical protein
VCLRKWNWDRLVAIVSTAWNFIPSHIQDLILGYAWQTVAGLFVMIAYLGWAAFTSLPAIVNTALAFVLFVAGLCIGKPIQVGAIFKARQGAGSWLWELLAKSSGGDALPAFASPRPGRAVIYQ